MIVTGNFRFPIGRLSQSTNISNQNFPAINSNTYLALSESHIMRSVDALGIEMIFSELSYLICERPLRSLGKILDKWNYLLFMDIKIMNF